MDPVRTRLRQGLRTALKARDRIAVDAIRSALAAIENAEAIDVPESQPRAATSARIAGATAGVGSSEAERRDLSEAEIVGIIDGQIQERSQAAEDYDALGKAEAAQRLREEAAVLRSYVVPAQPAERSSNRSTSGSAG
jgi:uncharacterized protein YqeY